MAWKAISRAGYLYRRSATFYVRRRVPSAMREAFGKEFFIVALKTSDPAEAKRLAAHANAAFQRQLDELAGRRPLDPNSDCLLDEMSVMDIEEMVGRWFATGYRAGAAAFVTDTAEDDGDISLRRKTLARDVAMLSLPDHPSHEHLLSSVVGHIVRTNGLRSSFRDVGGGILVKSVPIITADRTGLKYRRFIDLVRRAMIELINQELSQLAFASSTIVDPELRAAVSGERSGRHMRLSRLIEEFQNDPNRAKVRAKGNADYRFVFRLLFEVIGEDRRVGEITRQDCRSVRDLLKAMPSNSTKIYPNLSFLDAARAAKEDGKPLLSEKTINSHLHKMSTLFKFAVDEEYMGRNPARSLASKGAQHSSSDRLPFSGDQLVKIFSAPIFTGCADDQRRWATPGPLRHRGTRFWVPVLALFEGMRLNEICQLRCDDVNWSDGIGSISVETLDDEDGEDRRVKTDAGRRLVPIHSSIEGLGFQAYVSRMRLSGSVRLFPDLNIDARGYYSDGFQKWFSRLVQKQGARQPRTSFHSFRHSWRQALRDNGAPAERVRIMGGWKPGDTSDKYGFDLALTEAKNEIEKIRFDNVLAILGDGRSDQA